MELQKSGTSVSKIETLLDRLNKKGKKVLITIDEAVANENMRIFASQFQIFIRKNYPVFLIMTGLYENIYEIQNDPVLTFLLRAPKIILGPLGINQIKNEYQNIFQIDDEKPGNWLISPWAMLSLFRRLACYTGSITMKNHLTGF